MKSTKLDKAINRARNNDEEPGDGEAAATALEVLKNTGIQRFDPEAVARTIKEAGYVAGEQLATLEVGQMISGYLIGRGTAMLDDPASTADKPLPQRAVGQLRFELDSGARLSILEDAQLSRYFREDPADGSSHCIVAKSEQSKTKKNRNMNNWYVFIKSMARQPTRQLPAPQEDLMEPKA